MKGREANAATIAVGVLDEAGLSGPTWVVGDATGEVETAVRERGHDVLAWCRSALHGPMATAWPPDRDAGSALIRLPKGRDALRMVLHAVAARTADGGSLILYGANDEGARSAGKTLGEVASEVRTLDTRRHCRVWRGQKRADVAFLRNLDDWASVAHASDEGGLEWVSFPGLFAHGHLDAASASLLRQIPALPPGSRVLDFGCGAGVLSLALQRRHPDAEIHALDVDPLALEATRRNVPGATLHLGDGLRALPSGLDFDAIVSNPPIHTGIEQHTRIVRDLCLEAASRLRTGGYLRVVAGRGVPLHQWVSPYRHHELVRPSRSFQILHARRA